MATKQIKMPIVLALTTDEETKLKSVELMIEKMKELNIKPKFTIIGEPTNSEFNLCLNVGVGIQGAVFWQSVPQQQD